MSRPKSAHDLSGLMKYLGRAPWDEMMDEMLVAHLGPACDAMDLEPDDIFDIIGDHWEAQLWGCAFEDLLTQELEPEGLNLVDEYLKRRGWNEKAPNKAYMRALRDTVMSLYEAQSARSCDFGHLGEHVGNGLVVVDDRPCEERRSAPIRERRYEPWRFEWGSDRLLEPEFFGHRVRDRQSGDGTTGIGGSA
ncbi:MAG TPA: hypothetical protein VF463_00015 [Sphingobium sp.]